MGRIESLVDNIFPSLMERAKAYDVEKDPYFAFDGHLANLLFSFDAVWDAVNCVDDPVSCVRISPVKLDEDARLLVKTGCDPTAYDKSVRLSDILNGFMSSDEERENAAKGLLLISAKARLLRDVKSYKRGEKIC